MRLVTLVVVGADPDRGRVYTVVGWLDFGTNVDPVADLRKDLELVEAAAEGLRSALLRR